LAADRQGSGNRAPETDRDPGERDREPITILQMRKTVSHRDEPAKQDDESTKELPTLVTRLDDRPAWTWQRVLLFGEQRYHALAPARVLSFARIAGKELTPPAS
jgi:hypothetical protein